MIITKTFYAKDRLAWRNWLKTNVQKKPEIWLIYYKKHTQKPCVSYAAAVEEALCFGWIDTTVKSIDDQKYAQRYCPRRPGSVLSELNKDRVRRMIKARKMTKRGLDAIAHRFSEHKDKVIEKFVVASDIKRAIKLNPKAWRAFQELPDRYLRIRIGYIEQARSRTLEFQRRLSSFIRMTAANKRFGSIR